MPGSTFLVQVQGEGIPQPKGIPGMFLGWGLRICLEFYIARKQFSRNHQMFFAVVGFKFVQVVVGFILRFYSCRNVVFVEYFVKSFIGCLYGLSSFKRHPDLLVTN